MFQPDPRVLRAAAALANLERAERELREARERAEIARQEFKEAAAALDARGGAIHLAPSEHTTQRQPHDPQA